MKTAKNHSFRKSKNVLLCIQSTLFRLLPPPPHPSQITPLPSASSSSSDAQIRKYIGYTLLVLGCGAATYYSFPFSEDAKHKKAQLFRYAPLPEDLHTVSNWSGTHEVQTRTFLQPESLEQLEDMVRKAHESKQKIRPVGSGLSPNGIGLTRAGMVNLALMDKVLEVDKEKKLVRAEAGIRVQQLVDGIKEYGITLQNFALLCIQSTSALLCIQSTQSQAIHLQLPKIRWNSIDPITDKSTPYASFKSEKWIVVSVSDYPSDSLRKLSKTHGWQLLAVGNSKTPKDWSLKGTIFLPLEMQAQLGFRVVDYLPYDSWFPCPSVI